MRSGASCAFKISNALSLSCPFLKNTQTKIAPFSWTAHGGILRKQESQRYCTLLSLAGNFP